MVSRQLSGEWEKLLLPHRSDKRQAAAAAASASISCTLAPNRLLPPCLAPQCLAALEEDRQSVASVQTPQRGCLGGFCWVLPGFVFSYGKH